MIHLPLSAFQRCIALCHAFNVPGGGSCLFVSPFLYTSSVWRCELPFYFFIFASMLVPVVHCYNLYKETELHIFVFASFFFFIRGLPGCSVELGGVGAFGGHLLFL
jgi:hypothetical protein